jgi:hypothetical protein
MGRPHHPDANDCMFTPNASPAAPAVPAQERLAALGLTPERPVAWRPLVLMDGPAAYRGVASPIANRVGREGQEFLLCALNPEGDAALAKMLGLGAGISGWVRQTPALEEAEARGLCFVHSVAGPAGLYFVVARTSAQAAAALVGA